MFEIQNCGRDADPCSETVGFKLTAKQLHASKRWSRTVVVKFFKFSPSPFPVFYTQLIPYQTNQSHIPRIFII